MDKLLYEYEKTGAIKSKIANWIWKGGVIVASIFYFIWNSILTNENSIFVYIAVLLVLYSIAELFFLKKAVHITKFNGKISLKNVKKIYAEINKYQKDWVSDFCKKNKIDNFNKLNVVLQELRKDGDKSTIKYINPIIIGTLLLTVWEIALQRIVGKVGFYNMLAIVLVLVIGISIGIGIFTKMLVDDKEIFMNFDNYSNKKRLEKLVVYRILKCKR